MSKFNTFKCRVCAGFTILMVFLFYCWMSICHRGSMSSIQQVCGGWFRDNAVPWTLVPHHNFHEGTIWQPNNVKMPFPDAIAHFANDKRIILLSLMDMGCLDMAVNLYLSSYRRMNISNYLFISSDNMACQEMHKQLPDAHCIHYADDRDASHASSFGSKAFVRKTYFKSQAVQEALLLDYNVLLMDIDIVLFRDPFPYFDKCPECDLQIQWDHGSVCSGFYFIRATDGGKLFMEKVWKIAEKGNMKGREQTSFSQAVNGLKGHEGFKNKVLPEKEFPNGNAYFHGNKIMFVTDGIFPPTSYLVHDNWIISQAAKIYRFKENFMWCNDNHGYYSNPDEKYLMYNDKFPQSDRIIDYQIQALKAALLLGHILKRIVIFPSFTCHTCKTKQFPVCKVKSRECSFITHWKMEQFDKSFQGLYREHMFLSNQLVPLSVKHSKSEVLLPDIDDKVNGTSTSIVRFPLSQFQRVQDIVEWFSKYRNISVLVLDHLQPTWSLLSDKFQDGDIGKKLKSAFKRSNYIQE